MFVRYPLFFITGVVYYEGESRNRRGNAVKYFAHLDAPSTRGRSDNVSLFECAVPETSVLCFTFIRRVQLMFLNCQ